MSIHSIYLVSDLEDNDNGDPLRDYLLPNIQSNKMQLELFCATRFLHRTVCVQGLVRKPLYNGRRGKAVEVLEPGRYAVILDASESDGIGVPVHILVHEDNLVLV